MILPHNATFQIDERCEKLLTRLRRKQLNLALQGDFRQSAAVAQRAERVLEIAESSKIPN